MKNKNNIRLLIAMVAIIFAAATTSCKKEETVKEQLPISEVLKATGDSLSISATLAQFKSLLGDSLNTAPGKIGGRREMVSMMFMLDLPRSLKCLVKN